MKTRIKVIEKYNGKKYYEVQYKPFYDRPFYVKFTLLCLLIVGIAFIIPVLFLWQEDETFFTLEDAEKRCLELHADHEKTLAKKTKKVSYIKYP